MSRLVIGLGFRQAATARSIGEVLANVVARAERPEATPLLAVVEDKAAHPGLLAAAETVGFPIEIVSTEAMREADTRIATRSDRVLRQRGVGSVCEAAALAAAGPDARLVVTRLVSTDRMATAAAALLERAAP